MEETSWERAGGASCAAQEAASRTSSAIGNFPPNRCFMMFVPSRPEYARRRTAHNTAGVLRTRLRKSAILLATCAAFLTSNEASASERKKYRAGNFREGRDVI